MTTIPQPSSLLLATDLGARCDRALERAIGLASTWKARLVIVSVLPPPEQHAINEELFGQADWGPSLSPRQYAERRLQRDLGDRIAGLEVTLRLEEGTVGSSVLRVAQEEGCGLIITGLARDAVFESARLGSSVTWLSRHSRVPLLLVRNRAHSGYRSMVLANDNSPTCRQALEHALGLFGEPLQLDLVTALELSRTGLLSTSLNMSETHARHTANQQALHFLADCQLSEDLRGRTGLVFDDGEPARVVSRYVRDHDSDLVIVGSHGRSPLSNLLLGSDAQRLLASAQTDTLLVRRAPAESQKT